MSALWEAVPLRAVPPAPDSKKFPLTEAGNSERFAELYGDSLLFVPAWGSWMVYDQTHWRRDDGDIHVLLLAKFANRSIATEAQDCADPKDFKAYLDWARSSDRLANRIATVRGARSEVATVEPDQFDGDPMLLNFANGTVELRSGTLREHRPGDRITRVLPWSFDSSADCPLFKKFLLEVLPDSSTVEYFWRAFGYSLTGSTDEHAVFFAYGRGSNGKTTLFRVLLAALGDYASQGMNDLLLAKQNEQHPVGVAELHGRRFVAMTEINEHKRWDAATLKFLSGSDRITARRMRENPWSFDPSHKFWIAANAKPSAAATDEALWRRIKLINFGRRFQGTAKDTGLPAKLKEEIPGILRLAVEACLRWQESGLGEPEAVTSAVDEYRREVDQLAGFFDAREQGPDARISRSELRGDYEAWARARGEEPISARAFTTRVRAREGVFETTVRVQGGVREGWRGIGRVGRRGDVGVVTLDDGIEGLSREANGENAPHKSPTPYVREPGSDDDTPTPPRGLS